MWSFDARYRRAVACGVALLALPGAARACAPPPPPVVDIDVSAFYGDPSSSIIDPARYAAYRAAMQPLWDFRDAITKASSRYAAAPGTHEADGACAVDWLTAWAREGALLGEMRTQQAMFERKWMLGTFTLSYARVEPLASAAQDAAFKAWAGEVAGRVRAAADDSKGKKNNHYYWEGLAVAAVGRLTGDAGDLAWGRMVFDYGMDQIQPDGTLPFEMARRTRALHYQNFAAAPLVMLAAILGRDDPRLHALVDYNVRATADPAIVVRATGETQIAPTAGDVAYFAIYARHAEDPIVRECLATHRIGTDVFLGGDVAVRNPLEVPDGG